MKKHTMSPNTNKNEPIMVYSIKIKIINAGVGSNPRLGTSFAIPTVMLKI